MYERLIDIFRAVGAPKVLVVGDFMLDNYLYGNTDRISPEAPVLVMNVTEREARPGGAGSVVVDLAALEAETACLGIIGDDENGRRIQQMLRQTGRVNVDGLVVTSDRPTTSKQRVVGLAQHRHRQQLLRIDEENNGEITEQVQKQLQTRLGELIKWCDVVCLADYNKGVLGGDFCRQVISQAKQQNKKVIVDPARTNDYSRYKGAWIVKPNRSELALASGRVVDGPQSWQAAAETISKKYDIENVVVTLDKQGAYVYQGKDGKDELVPTRPRSVYDVTGAGDMVLAMLGLLAGGRYNKVVEPTISEIVWLANVAGGLEVERFGCVGISREEILMELARQHGVKTSKLRSRDGLLKELQWHRRQKLKIVFTNGCFDILHPGHINLLSFAKEQGDVLVVAINSDRSVRQLKGPGRPILSEQERAVLLSALEAVDYVVIFDEPDPLPLIELIGPDVLVKGSDWQGKVVGQESVEARGGQVVLMPLVKGFSTTNIIEQVLKQYGNQPANG